MHVQWIASTGLVSIYLTHTLGEARDWRQGAGWCRWVRMAADGWPQEASAPEVLAEPVVAGG
eukprot:1157221-Pelagomonas_calceolata.AAC.11